MQSNAKLTIQGKVNPGIIKFRTSTHKQEWLFIDYAENNIPLDEKMIITAIQGVDNLWYFSFDKFFEQISAAPETYAFRILECLNQSNKKLKEIPKGHKTICKIEFHPEVPIWIQRLKLREGWGFHTEQITLFYTNNSLY